MKLSTFTTSNITSSMIAYIVGGKIETATKRKRQVWTLKIEYWGKQKTND